MTEKGTLTPTQHRAISALLSCPDNRAAAKAAGISERKLYRLLAEPSFNAELQRASGQSLELVIRRMAELCNSAVQVLADIMLDKGASKGTRVQAASVLLSRLMELRDAHDLEERMQRIEKELNL